MAKNARKSQDIQESSFTNEANDYIDTNNGTIYNITHTKAFDSCTITFLTQATYNEITKLLKAEYSFKPNGNGSATVASTEMGAQKVVLTLYRTRKLLVQGAGTWAWRNTVFRSLSKQLTPSEPENTNSISTCNTPIRRNNSKQMDNTNANSSPAAVLNKVLNEIKSPKSSSTPVNSSSSLKRKTGPNKKSSSEKQQSSFIEQSYTEESSVVELDSEDDITTVKQLYKNNGQLLPSKEKKSMVDNSSLQTIKTELEKQKAENKELQNASRALITQTSKLREENEQLLKSLEAKTSEINSMKKALQNKTKTLQDSDTKIKTLEEKLASANADRLIFEENNNKLKADIISLKSEKAMSLSEKVRQGTGLFDLIESNLDNLKGDLMTEIQQIKEQLKRSVDMQLKINDQVSTSHKEIQTRSTNSQDSQKNSTAPISYSHGKTVLIAGDDTTSILSPRVMTDNNMTVKIKSHRNGRVSTVESMLVKLAYDNRDYLKSLKAVVMHAGAGNIADAETPESVAEELKTAADTIRNVNPEAKILISSLIPRINDRLTNTAIHETNILLKTVCTEHNYVFVDNSKNFLKDGKPDVSLYKDTVNLNKKGGKFLGQNIRDSLNSSLGIQVQPRHEKAPYEPTQNQQDSRVPGLNQQGFRVTSQNQQGFRVPAQTQQGFRVPEQQQQNFRVRSPPNMQGIHPNGMIPPWMQMYPPWFPPHPQMQFWK